jgi:tRNA nucleotidyltransferase (CCA-adding enzyme)
MGLPTSKDLDFEVYGLQPEELMSVLEQVGIVRAVGKSFGIYLLVGTNAEFALPRKESKQGQGHRGFMVEFDPTLSTYEATKRRDFTMNSMLLDVDTGELTDHHGGVVDVQNNRLRATSIAFKEDPLRVLRGMQFISRFNLRASMVTIEYSRQMLAEASTLSRQRLWWEWYKWGTLGTELGKGLEFLRMTDWITLWPMLEDLKGVEQDPGWHPEGDVWDHTKAVVDNAKFFAHGDKLSSDDAMIQVLVALLHDTGKASTTTTNPETGRIIAPKHEAVSVDLASQFMDSIYTPIWMQQQVRPLVQEHMFRRGRHGQVTPRAVRRLSVRLDPATIQQLTRQMQADSGERDNETDAFAHHVNVVAAEVQVEDSKPRPLLMGRHLIELGETPRPQFGSILADAYESQLDGVITEKNKMDWLRSRLKEGK